MSYFRYVFLLLIFCLFQTSCLFESGSTSLIEINRQALPSQFFLEEDAGQNWILLPVSLNGKTHHFVLDTGASHTLFDSSLRKELGNSIGQRVVETVAEPVTLERYRLPKAFIGNLKLQGKENIFVHDFSLLKEVSGKNVKGLLGMDFLRNFLIQIDFQQRIIRFLDSEKSEAQNWGTEFPLHFDSYGLPFLDSTFKGVELKFIIDTGSIGESLEEGAFSQLVWQEDTAVRNTRFWSLAGNYPSQETHFSPFSVGANRYKSIRFRSAKRSKLGLSFLSKHLVTLDFPKKKIYLKQLQKEP